MSEAHVLIIAVLIFGFVLVSRRLDERSISGPLVFTLLGVVAGGLGVWQETGETSRRVVEVLAESALVMIVFSDATRLRPGRLRRQRDLPARLLLVAFPLTVVLGMIIGALLFDQLRWSEALVLAAVLAPTDAALCEPAISNHLVPTRVRQALNFESGMNDGMTVPVITLALALAASQEGELTDWLGFVVTHVGFGVLAGIVGGVLGAQLLNRFSTADMIEGTFRQLGVMAVPVMSYAGAEIIDGNGVVAAFVAGIAFGQLVQDRYADSATDFAEEEGHLLILLTFLFWSIIELVPRLDELNIAVAAYVLASLTVVRMVPVALATIGLDLRPPTVAYLGWFGPRGLASVIFTYSVLEDLKEGPAEVILLVATWTVAVSVVAHSLTARPWSNRYGRWFQSLPDENRSDLPEAADVGQLRHRLR